MESTKPQLAYWNIRHLSSALRYQLAYCKVDYDMKTYALGEAPEFSKKEWLSKKYELGLSFPNLPYFIDGDVSLTETIPIHKYIADKWMPELLGKDPKTRGTVGMMANVIYEFKFKLAVGYYTTGLVEQGQEAIR